MASIAASRTSAGCTACLAKRPAQWGLDIATWRGAFGRVLRGANRVIAPSQDVAVRMRRYFPDLAIEVWPHPEGPPAPVPHSVARVAVLGNLSPEKGLHVVAACARDARERDLPLTFRVLGSTTEPIRAGARRPAHHLRPVRRQRAAAPHRRGEARCAAVRRAGAGDVCVHALGRAAVGRADRRVRARRVPRAPGRSARARPRYRGTRRPDAGTTRCSPPQDSRRRAAAEPRLRTRAAG